jgi:hypothetical protein
VMVNERSDGPLFGEDVRTDNAKNFTHSKSMATCPYVCNGSNGDLSREWQLWVECCH